MNLRVIVPILKMKRIVIASRDVGSTREENKKQPLDVRGIVVLV